MKFTSIIKFNACHACPKETIKTFHFKRVPVIKTWARTIQLSNNEGCFYHLPSPVTSELVTMIALLLCQRGKKKWKIWYHYSGPPLFITEEKYIKSTTQQKYTHFDLSLWYIMCNSMINVSFAFAYSIINNKVLQFYLFIIL